MIKYNNNTIIDWNLGTSNIKKVYRNGAVVYYKLVSSSPTPEYMVCYAVVDDITQYQDRTYADVYDKATSRFYKLNNLNQYEVYGIYGTGRNITTYEGKLTIDEGYEYEYSGSSWVNIGEVSGTTESYKYWMWRSIGDLNTEGTIQFSEFDLVVNGSDVNLSLISAVPTGFSNEGAANLFDNNTSTKYYASFTPYKNTNYVLFEAESAIAPTTFSMTTANDSATNKRYPKEWALYGSNTSTTDWNDGSWTMVVSGTCGDEMCVNYTRFDYAIPKTRIIKSPEYLQRDSVNNGYLGLGEYFQENTKIEIDFQMTQAKGNAIIGDYGSNDNDDWRVFINYDVVTNNLLNYDFYTNRYNYNTGDWSQRFKLEIGNYYIKDLNTGDYLINTTSKTSFTRPNQMYLFHMDGRQNTNNIDYGHIYSVKIYQDDVLTKDFIPWTDLNGNYGLFDKVSKTVFNSTNQMSGSSTINDVIVSNTDFPKYYAEKTAPLDDLTFNTMEEANTYAYNNCVYQGMRATINGTRYYFDTTNGWTLRPYYYTVEDVTPNGASGWTINGSSTYNPNPSIYDDFDLETTWTSNSYKIAKVTIYGYEHFTYYLRSHHFDSYTYGYVMATNIDELNEAPTSMTYGSEEAITNTYNFNKNAGSSVSTYNYRRVTYNNIDKNTEHTFYVVFYGKAVNSTGTATILVPKDQSTELWEEVVCSASTNVDTTNKTLSFNGSTFTNYFYQRWIMGVPSGSNTMSINYSDYNYCPEQTTYTFTSETGNTRNINFVYNSTQTKYVSIRLVDENANVITPSDTVYYYIYKTNACSIQISNTYQLPTYTTMPVGGYFNLGNYNNRHYIYGYALPSNWSSTVYTDNIGNTYDLVYTKLDTEDVTITYTTYDPNDTEVPVFNTNITYPYNGGTTSATSLTTFEVPYTYPYTVSNSNKNLVADSQAFTASQSARTVSFTFYPNNKVFATLADLQAYGYAWEGMIAYVGEDKYKYENGEWVYNPSRLPNGYTEVEYIENPNNSLAYIDTGFKPNQDTRIVTTMQIVTSSNYGRFIGAGLYYSSNAMQFDYEINATGNLYISWGHIAGWTSYPDCVGDYNVHEYDWDKNYFYRDKGESNEFSASTTYTSFQCTDNLGIFAFIDNGAVNTMTSEHLYGRMYSFQMYDNGTLIRDLVPCKRNSDDMVGAYDIVNDVFYYPPNYQSYQFIAGGEVE